MARRRLLSSHLCFEILLVDVYRNFIILTFETVMFYNYFRIYMLSITVISYRNIIIINNQLTLCAKYRILKSIGLFDL